MVIKETAIFTNIIQQLITDDEYILLQEYLVCFPKYGKLIKGSKGLRKFRWKKANIGKRGGIRIIYYFLEQQDQIYFLYAYQKNQQADLTAQQLKQLVALVKEELET